MALPALADVTVGGRSGGINDVCRDFSWRSDDTGVTQNTQLLVKSE